MKAVKNAPQASPGSWLRSWLWRERPASRLYERLLVQCGRYLFAVLRDLLASDELSLRAMSLVYTTLLSVVPLLALAFSVLKALGAHNSLEPVLEQFLRPLGPQSAEISQKVMAFVEKIQVGVLGFVGVALLFYTTISLIRKVESSFNFIWRIERPQGFAQRVGEYLGVLMVGPTLLFTALGITASVLKSSVIADIAQIQPLGWLIYALTRLLPYLIIVGLFSFLYGFLVNARVRWTSALAGGLTAGVLWQTCSLVFASFVANAGNYNAVYSSFAIVIFLLIWIHVGWLVLLIGCQLAFYVQNPRQLQNARRPLPMNGRDAEYLGLSIMAISATRFLRGEPALIQDELIRVLDAPAENVSRTLQLLIACGYLAESGRERSQLLPARDPSAIRLGDLWRDLRAQDSRARTGGELGLRVTGLLDDAQRAFDSQSGDLSLRDWLQLPATGLRASISAVDSAALHIPQPARAKGA